MQNTYPQLAAHNRWRSDKHPTLHTIPKQWRDWLYESGSLTSKLVHYSNNQFAVRVLKEHWGKPFRHEQRKLKSPLHQIALIREVELICENQVAIFARSVIPLGVAGDKLKKLGSKPLGHLLFKQGRMRVNQREIAQIKQNDGSLVYARRTPYKYLQQEILISEFFINADYFL